MFYSFNIVPFLLGNSPRVNNFKTKQLMLQQCLELKKYILIRFNSANLFRITVKRCKGVILAMVMQEYGRMNFFLAHYLTVQMAQKQVIVESTYNRN